MREIYRGHPVKLTGLLAIKWLMMSSLDSVTILVVPESTTFPQFRMTSWNIEQLSGCQGLQL